MRDLVAIANEARKWGVPFLVAGGHAVIAHGHPRMTFDLDLLICQRDKVEWRALVLGLGYTLLGERSAFMQFQASPAAAFPLDLMTVGSETFQKLNADSVPLGLPGVDARMVSIRHLIALKCHALQHGGDARRVKDTDDLIELIKANHISLREPEIQAIILKHGNEDLYSKIRRACESE
jgi:hypothetical protein